MKREVETMKKILSFLMLIVLLAGCASKPEQQPVISKKDGSFDVDTIVTVAGTEEATENADEADVTTPDALEPYSYEETFSSTDGSVQFIMQLNGEISIGENPVVEVSPHVITAEDAKRIAESMFDGVEFYEADPIMAPRYSKGEVQSFLSRWTQYANQEALTELYCMERPGDLKLIQGLIEKYTRVYESAPDESSKTPCAWQFKKESQYLLPPADAAALDTSNENDQICAVFTYQGIPYKYTVSVRDRSDFKVNNIHIELAPVSPADIDYKILHAELCRTEKPSDEQVKYAEEQANIWLSELGFGKWAVVDSKISTAGCSSNQEYMIQIKATPEFSVLPVILRPQLNNLHSDEIYASNYYFSEASFTFAPGGELVGFDLLSPVDVQSVVADNAQVLTMDELVGRAKSHLELSDYYAYGLGESLDEMEEDILCIVDINSVKYGMTRVKAPNTDSTYYYIPAIAFYGNVEYQYSGSGEVCFENKKQTLLVLNAIDGSVIPLNNE